MMEFNVVAGNAPLDSCLTIVLFARRPFLLPVKSDRDPVPVTAGQRLVLNPEAFGESDLMTGAICALVSIGALQLIRDGVLN
jgi:hypothetical protein